MILPNGLETIYPSTVKGQLLSASTQDFSMYLSQMKLDLVVGLLFLNRFTKLSKVRGLTVSKFHNNNNGFYCHNASIKSRQGHMGHWYNL